jgi:uncharacterized damage-inducible protein DinB
MTVKGSVAAMSGEWVAPEVQRAEPDFMASEREQLDGWVDYHRNTLLHKCAGLRADQLKQRAVAPSALTLLGLVRHMTDVERWWFRMHAARQHVELRFWGDHLTGDFDEVDDADAAADLDAFRQEIEACKAAVKDVSLDEVVPSRGDHPDVRFSVRWIYFHMVEEYARHNGHADLLRECIDGTTGD